MLLFTYRKVVNRPTPTARPDKWKESISYLPHMQKHSLLTAYSPRACCMTSLAQSMTRKGRLFWSQRKRQRSSDKDVLGSPESWSASGRSSSGSEFEWCCTRLCVCDWEWEWPWEFTLHLLDGGAPLDSPAPLLMGTRTSLFSVLAAAAPGSGVLVRTSGCRVRDKPFPAWAPRSLELGCITVEYSLSFSALLESLLWDKRQTVCVKSAAVPTRCTRFKVS